MRAHGMQVDFKRMARHLSLIVLALAGIKKLGGRVLIAMSFRDACAGDVRSGQFLVGGVGRPY